MLRILAAKPEHPLCLVCDFSRNFCVKIVLLRLRVGGAYSGRESPDWSRI